MIFSEFKFSSRLYTRYYRKDHFELLEGPKPPPEFICDGCSWSPDYFKHYDLWPACIIHDYHYRNSVLGGKWASRREADWIFRANLQTILQQQGASKAMQWFVSWLYWSRVRIYGAHAYRWDQEERPNRVLHQILEAWGLFRDKRWTH